MTVAPRSRARTGSYVETPEEPEPEDEGFDFKNFKVLEEDPD